MDVIYRDTPIPALRERSGEQFFERRLMCGSFFCSRFGSSKLLLQLLVLAFEFSCHGAPEKGPPDFRLKHQVLHSHRQRTGQLSQLDQPTTQRAATNLEPSSQEDIFEAIKRSVVAELREGDVRTESWTGQPFLDRLRRLGSDHNVLLARTAGILHAVMLDHFDTSRDYFDLLAALDRELGAGLTAASALALVFG